MTCLSHLHLQFFRPLSFTCSDIARFKHIPCIQPFYPPSLDTILNRIDTNNAASSTADFVQELYLKELKAYKAPALKANDAEGQVLTFNQPKTPKSPEEADLASSLQEYENMAVEVEGQEGASASKPAAAVEDWLVEEDEEEHAHGH